MLEPFCDPIYAKLCHTAALLRNFAVVIDRVVDATIAVVAVVAAAAAAGETQQRSFEEMVLVALYQLDTLVVYQDVLVCLCSS